MISLNGPKGGRLTPSALIKHAAQKALVIKQKTGAQTITDKAQNQLSGK